MLDVRGSPLRIPAHRRAGCPSADLRFDVEGSEDLCVLKIANGERKRKAGTLSRSGVGIHFAEQASQGSGVAGSERPELFAEAAFADSANLISGDL
jgi:hypothetical protein